MRISGPFTCGDGDKRITLVRVAAVGIKNNVLLKYIVLGKGFGPRFINVDSVENHLVEEVTPKRTKVRAVCETPRSDGGNLSILVK